MSLADAEDMRLFLRFNRAGGARRRIFFTSLEVYWIHWHLRTWFRLLMINAHCLQIDLNFPPCKHRHFIFHDSLHCNIDILWSFILAKQFHSLTDSSEREWNSQSVSSPKDGLNAESRQTKSIVLEWNAQEITIKCPSIRKKSSSSRAIDWTQQSSAVD